MQRSLTLVMAQLDFIVGDIEANTDKIIAACAKARDEHHADVIVFPELAITGYPPEDLLLRPELYRRVAKSLSTLQTQVHGIYLVIGHPWQDINTIYNAASVIYNGEVVGQYYKHHLPNYSVFDEKRYFIAGNKACVVPIKGHQVALSICEDLWLPGPMQQACDAGAELMLCLNASPFHARKRKERAQILQKRQQEAALIPIIYVNLVGGQDELVFDGGSFVLDSQGNITQQASLYEESLELVVCHDLQPQAKPLPQALTAEENIYQALVLGTRDYVNKNGFKGVIIGLSGGIDSALTLTIAVDALGPERVHAVLMPSRYTADMSVEDAIKQAETLGVEYSKIPIEEPFNAFLNALSDEFAGLSEDTTEENIQARCRGIILMAISNKTGRMVLTTGNKSELAVGYATLYGDMAGGYAVIKDVPKTLVYRLANYRNSLSAAIPQRIIDRPPSAELAADQTDQDFLPAYDTLDEIMSLYVEHDQSVEKIIAKGFAPDTLARVTRLIDRNEYKRRQAAPGVRISKRAFGRDWRYPITSKFGDKK